MAVPLLSFDNYKFYIMGIFDYFKKKEDNVHTQQQDLSRTINPTAPNIIGKYYTLDKLNRIPMGQIYLQPIDADIIFDSDLQRNISIMSNISPKISKFLPKFNISSENDVLQFFINFCKKTEAGYGFGYAIKMGSSILGFIFINTPAINVIAINFPQWTIDFCLFEPFEKKGIMIQCLARILYFLKVELDIRNIYAIVSQENTDSINLLSHLPFDLQQESLTDPTTGEKAKLFCCPIHEINFQHC